MRSRQLVYLLAAAVLLGSPILARTAHAAWPSDSLTNVMVSTGPGPESSPLIVADGAAASGGKTGALIAWTDGRNGSSNTDVYMQHVLWNGAIDPVWPAAGLAVCAASGNQVTAAIVSDGHGGAIVIWIDGRNAGNSWDLYAQHVLASGAVDPAWPSGGAPVSVMTGNQWNPVAVADGSGGATIVWQDERGGASNPDIYANHLLASGVIDGNWPANGRVVCNATGSQLYPVAVSDGAGGVIASWTDLRASGDIYVQRMSSTTGLPVWTANGVALCTATSIQEYPVLIADGGGGAIAIWEDWRNNATTGWDIYAGHVTSTGAVDAAWPANGLAVSTNTSDQRQPRAISDGSGGALVVFSDSYLSTGAGLSAHHVLAGGTLDPAWPVAGLHFFAGSQSGVVTVSDSARGVLACWADARGGTDLYAQRVRTTGVVDPRWPPAGVAVSAGPNAQVQQVLLAVDDGDAIAAWTDYRGGSTPKVYAQRLSTFGTLGSTAPRIASARDIANDQGGKLRVLWEASAGDVPSLGAIADYRLWRRAVIAGTTSWEFLADVPAKGVAGYGYLVETAADSTSAGVPWNAFKVTAYLSDGITFFASPLDSGYSVDNLAPGAPQQLAGAFARGTTTLTWAANPEPDVAAYRVYRGDSPDFAPSATWLVAEVPATTFADPAGVPCWYRVSAVDVHGNEGPGAVLAPTSITGAGPPGIPMVLALSPPRPNPARESVRLEFTLPGEALVRLAVYDAGGRRVCGLLDTTLPAGAHRIDWELAADRGGRLASGLYFARLEVGGRRLVRRFAILR